MKLVQIGAVVVVLAAIAALSGVGRPEAANGSAPNARSVTVSGSGDVEAVPDRAGLSVGVSSDASTAGAALAANAAKAARVLEALRSAGVAKQDLQTQDVTVSPRWDDEGDRNGVTAHSSVEVKVRRLAQAGELLDAAVAAGATETSGPSFDRSDRAELYRAALKAAFADARAKAATLAGAAWADARARGGRPAGGAAGSLGRVLRIEESSQTEQPLPMYDRMAAEAKTPVEPGSEQVDATVRVTFSLS